MGLGTTIALIKALGGGGGGIPPLLAMLGDVDIYDPQNGQILVFDGDGQYWYNSDIPGTNKKSIMQVEDNSGTLSMTYSDIQSIYDTDEWDIWVHGGSSYYPVTEVVSEAGSLYKVLCLEGGKVRQYTCSSENDYPSYREPK